MRSPRPPYWPGVAFRLNLTYTSFNFYVFVFVVTSNFNFYTSFLCVLSNLTFTSSPLLTHYTSFWLTFYTSFGANFINPIWIFWPRQMHTWGCLARILWSLSRLGLEGASALSAFVFLGWGCPSVGDVRAQGCKTWRSVENCSSRPKLRNICLRK